VLASLAAATSPRLSRSVRLYLFTQTVTIILGEVALALVGWVSPFYVAIYVVGAIACRIASWWVIESVGSHWLERVVALAFALVVAWLAYHNMNPVAGLEPRIILPDGFLLVSMGMTLGFQAPFHKDRQVLVPLAVMWLLLGCFDFGILMNKGETWAKINDVGSYIIAITCFAWVAFSQRLHLRRQPVSVAR